MTTRNDLAGMIRCAMEDAGEGEYISLNPLIIRKGLATEQSVEADDISARVQALLKRGEKR